jgi:hypothetical protein
MLQEARHELGIVWPIVGFPKALMHTRILEVRSWRSSDYPPMVADRPRKTPLSARAYWGCSEIIRLVGRASPLVVLSGSLSRLPDRVVSK